MNSFYLDRGQIWRHRKTGQEVIIQKTQRGLFGTKVHFKGQDGNPDSMPLGEFDQKYYLPREEKLGRLTKHGPSLKLNYRKVRSIMIRKSLSTAAVAQIVGVTKQAVSKWINKNAAISSENLLKLAKALGVLPEDLL